MRKVQIRRHSFTKKGEARGRGSHLSREGVLAARRLGASLGRFDTVLASTSPRTMETAIAMGAAVDDLIEMPSPVETGEIDFHAWRTWDDPFATLRTMADASPAVNAYLTDQVARLVDALDHLADEGSALVIGHGGWIESVIARLVDHPPATPLGGSFWHLDGIDLLLTTASTATVTAVHRFPRP